MRATEIEATLNNRYEGKGYAKGWVGKVQRTFAMSEYGARSFLRAVWWSVLHYLTLSFPAMLVFLFIQQLLSSGTAVEAGLLGQLLWWMVGLVLICLLIMYVVAYQQYGSTYTAVYAESAQMRISMAEHLRHLPLSYFDRRDASDLTTLIMSDINTLEQQYSHQLPQLFGSLALLILMMVGLSFLDWRLSLALFWVVPVAVLLFIFSAHKMKQTMEEGNRIGLATTEKIDEGIQQIAVIKSHRQQECYLGELKTQLVKHEQSQMRSELVSGVVVNGIAALIQLGLPTLVLVGSTLLVEGSLSFSTLLFFILLSSSIFEPLQGAIINSAILLYTLVHVDRLNAVYDEPIMTGATDIEPNGFDITFDDVSFSYDKERKVLDGVHFVAKQGETTALIGPSGGGKSTCARLAARFWDVDSGAIKLGGIPLTAFDPEALLKYYSIVFQDVVLFNNSVLENIRIGRKEATDEEVLRAAEAAQCEEFVRRLPEGYDTIIGENGARLSGGERQRISIARAILKDAPIIILDEATASQDVDNETHIQRALSTLIKEKTVLVIAHRMRTIASADKIVVLEEGRVAEQGSPELLYAQNGIYTHMVDSYQEDL